LVRPARPAALAVASGGLVSRPTFVTCADCPAVLPVKAKGPIPSVCRPCWRARVRERWAAKQAERPMCAALSKDGDRCKHRATTKHAVGLDVCGQHTDLGTTLTFRSGTPPLVEPPKRSRCPTCGR
jgi:hypothetical protein